MRLHQKTKRTYGNEIEKHLVKKLDYRGGVTLIEVWIQRYCGSDVKLERTDLFRPVVKADVTGKKLNDICKLCLKNFKVQRALNKSSRLQAQSKTSE